jgi:hypothetical protein
MRILGFLAGAAAVSMAVLALWQGPALEGDRGWTEVAHLVMQSADRAPPAPSSVVPPAMPGPDSGIPHAAGPDGAEPPAVSKASVALDPAPAHWSSGDEEASELPGLAPGDVATRPAEVSGPVIPDPPPDIVDGTTAAVPDEQWEVFFTPFRSAASAQGFARFLQGATGRAFVVRRAGPGDYRVWFSLAPGESRPERLAEIESVTGMVLVGGEL